MKVEDELDSSLIAVADHLSDVTIGAIADGELDGLPPDALDHLESCAGCAQRVGQVAWLATEIQEAILVAPARRPLPIAAIAAALMVALLGMLPMALDFATELGRLPALVAHVAPILVHSVSLAVESISNRELLAAGALSTALLVMTGIAIARVAPRRMIWKEAV